MYHLPPINLDHLVSLTDDTGLLQHAKFSIPNRNEGYTTDDNARAFIVALRLAKTHDDSRIGHLTERYLGFLLHMQGTDGYLHNFLGYDRKYLDRQGSEDSQGRVLWATGEGTLLGASEDIRTTAKTIFDRCLPHSYNFTSPRAKAFTILGLCSYHESFPEDPNVLPVIQRLRDDLVAHYVSEASSDWRWFESYLTYENARLPYALLRSYETLGGEESSAIALDSLDFLMKTQTVEGIFVPVGNDGWFQKGGKMAIYDQQPIEAASTVESAIYAYRTTGQRRYLDFAVLTFNWFFGKNTKKVQVYRPENGACYDGISPEGVNKNQGAEAIVSFLLARLAMETIKDEQKLNRKRPTR
jgi:hypothetical protein